MRRFAIGTFAALLLAACTSGGRASVDYVTGRATINQFELPDEIALGQEQATLFIAASESLKQTINPDDVYTRTVRTVARRLLSVPENRARMPPVPWEIHTIGSETQNAFAVAGGVVFVLGGMLKWGWVRDEHELAAILGHEMAHVAARHPTERQTAAQMRSELGLFGNYFGKKLVELIHPEDPQGAIRYITEDAVRFDQAQELEADIIGMELMARAGYDPARAIDIWARLAEHMDDPKAGETSSHPAYRSRIVEMKRHLSAAQLVARRSNPPVDTSSTGWQWDRSDTDHQFGPVRLPEAGPLVEGSRVPSVFVHQSRRTLDTSCRTFIGPEGESPRAEIEVVASRDLVEDGLPFTAVLYVEQQGAKSALTVFGRRLAKQVPLKARTTQMRVVLPRLAAGDYLVRARTLLGALWTDGTCELHVPKGPLPELPL